MKAYMTIEDARKIKRSKINVGNTYTFYSDCVECMTESGTLLRHYSAQNVVVVKYEGDGDDLKLYTVRASNGDTFTANESELNGWIFDTGQWVGPRIN